jgi:O-antigen/teichoic acid export membrane protein
MASSESLAGVLPGARVGRFVANVSWLAGAQLCFRLIYLGLAIVLARTLSVQEYSHVTLILVFTTLWAPLFNFGLGIIGVREMAQRNIGPGEFIGSVLPLKLGLSLLALGLMVVTGVKLGYAAGGALPLVALTLSTVILSVAEFFHLPFTALENMRLTAWLTILERALIAVLAAGALLLGFLGTGFSLGHLAGAVLGTMLAFWLWREHFGPLRLRLDRAALRWYLVESFPVALNWLFSTGAARVSAIVLAAVRPGVEVAYFNTAFFLLVSFQMGATVVMQSVFPAMSLANRTATGSLQQTLSRTLRWGLPATILGCAVLVQLLGVITTGLFGANMAGAKGVASVLLWVVPIFAVNTLLGAYLQTAGRQAVVAASAAVGLLVGISLYATLARHLGAAGVAAGNVVAEIVNMLCMLIALGRSREKLISPALLGTLIMGSVGVLLIVIGEFRGWSAALAYALGGAGLLAWARSDVAYVTRQVRRISVFSTFGKP